MIGSYQPFHNYKVGDRVLLSSNRKLTGLVVELGHTPLFSGGEMACYKILVTDLSRETPTVIRYHGWEIVKKLEDGEEP